MGGGGIRKSLGGGGGGIKGDKGTPARRLGGGVSVTQRGGGEYDMMAYLRIYSLHNREEVGWKRRSKRDQLSRCRMLELQRARVEEGPRHPGALLQPAVPVLVAVDLVSQDGRAAVLNE